MIIVVQLSKSLTVVIQPLSTDLIKPNFCSTLIYSIFMIIKLKLFRCSIFDLQSCSPDPLLPSVLERTPAEEVDLANEEDRGLFRIHSLFSIYSVQQVSG